MYEFVVCLARIYVVTTLITHLQGTRLHLYCLFDMYVATLYYLFYVKLNDATFWIVSMFF